MSYIHFLLIFLGILSLNALAGIRIAREDERFVVLVMGKFIALKGPGLHVKLPFSHETWVRLRLGELGNYSGSGIARFGGNAIRVRFDKTPKKSVMVERFENNEIWVASSNVLDVRCEKCGHHNRIGI